MREPTSGPALAAAGATAVTATCLAPSTSASTIAVILAAGACAITATALWQQRATRAVMAGLRAALHRALTDPVTGLPVRRVADDALHDAGGSALTVALVDVDNLHWINHTYGHAFGDAYLAAVADALHDAAEPGDLLARLGGDEFLLITATAPRRLAARLDRHLTRPVTIDGHHLALAASAGICPVSGGDARTALGRADLAMLHAKHERAISAIHDPARHGQPPPPGTRPARRSRDRR